MRILIDLQLFNDFVGKPMFSFMVQLMGFQQYPLCIILLQEDN